MLLITYKHALALAFSFFGTARAQGPVVGPGNIIICTGIATASASSATTTSIVSGVAGKSIYVCGWHVTSILATTATFQFEYGTQGGPCTTPTVITPAMNVTSTAPSADHIDYAAWQVPAGQQLCVVTGTGTTGTTVVLFYNQF